MHSKQLDREQRNGTLLWTSLTGTENAGLSRCVFKILELKLSMLIRALPLKYEVDKLVTLINKLVNHFLMANGMS